MPDVYVRVSNEPVSRTSHHSDNTLNVDLDANGVPVGVEVLDVVEVTIDGKPARVVPTFPQDCMSKDIVERVTEALKGYRHHLGPNALSLIRDGVWKSLPLSLGEMRDIAWLLQEAGLLKEVADVQHSQAD